MARSAHEILIETIGRDRDALPLIERVAAGLAALPEEEHTKITVDATTANRVLDEVEAKVKGLANGRIGIDLDSAEARAHLAEFRAELETLVGDENVDISVRAKGLLETVAQIEAATKSIPDEKVTVELDADKSFVSRLSAMGSAVLGLIKNSDGLGTAFSGVKDAISSATVSIGPVTTSLSTFLALSVVLIPVITSIVGALAAMVAGLAAAAAALGVLAISAAAVLVPIAAIGIAAFTSFKAAGQAITDLKSATLALTQAEQAHADATRGVSNAKRTASQAEADLITARQKAATQIRSDVLTAHAAYDTAVRGLTDAETAETQAQVALTQARQDAARAMVDARIAAEGGALAERRAVLALNDARRQLAALETDPTAKVSDLRAARLAVADAELGVESSKVNSKRADEDLQASEKKGISGSDQVVAAKKAQADAETRVAAAHTALALATAKINKADAETVRNSAAVVAARRAVTNSDRAVATAQRNLARSSADLALKQKAFDNAQRNVAREVTPQYRELARALKDVRREFGAMTRAGVNAIFGGLADALETISPLMKALKPAFTELGQAIGGSFSRLAKELTSPAWERFFKLLIGGATDSVPTFTRALIGLLRILRNIVKAGLPFFQSAIEGIAGALGGAAKGTKDATGPIAGFMEQLATWGNVLKQIGRIIINFIGAALPDAKKMGDSMGDVLKNTADWLASTDGKKSVHQFLEQAIALAGALVKFVVALGAGFAALTTAMGPFLTPIIDGFTTIAKGIGFVIDLFNEIPAPIREFLGLILSMVLGFGKLKIGITIARLAFIALGAGVVTAFQKIKKWAKDGFNYLKDHAGDAVRFFASLPSKFFDAAVSIVVGITRGIHTLGSRILDFIRARFHDVISFIASLPKRFFDLAKSIVEKLVAGVRSLGSSIVGFFRDKFTSIFNFLKSIPGKMFDLGKDIIQGMIDGIKSLAGDLANTVKDVALAPVRGVKSLLGIGSPSKVMHELGMWTGKGFADGIEAAMGNVAVAAGKMAVVPAGAAGGGRGRGGSSVQMHNNFTVPGGGQPDADATIAAIGLALRRKGLSIA